MRVVSSKPSSAAWDAYNELEDWHIKIRPLPILLGVTMLFVLLTLVYVCRHPSGRASRRRMERVAVRYQLPGRAFLKMGGETGKEH
jgi:hypothetical protein